VLLYQQTAEPATLWSGPMELLWQGTKLPEQQPTSACLPPYSIFLDTVQTPSKEVFATAKQMCYNAQHIGNALWRIHIQCRGHTNETFSTKPSSHT
jgi:hypothetical protein